MTALRVEQFKGIAPAISDVKLADGAATSVTGAKIVATSIESEKNVLDVEPFPTGTNSFFRTDFDNVDYWFTSTTAGLSYVESPVIQDAHERVYIAGGTEPRYTTKTIATTGFDPSGTIAKKADGTTDQPTLPANTYRLGVPVFTLPGSGTADGTATDASISFSTFYVFTIVTEFGEEGAPSPVSTRVDYQQGQHRDLTFPSKPTLTTSDYALGSGAKIRIYRTAAGSSRASFLFVGETAYANTTFADTVSDDALGEPITSTFYFKPFDDDASYAPDGPLKKIVSMANGYLAGFAGKTVCFSEIYLPHAWSPNNFLMTESNIVTIQECSFGLVVLTETVPYVAVGASPDAMSLQKLDIDQACISANSVADMGGMVVFASPDGLVGIEGNSASVLTDGIITRDQWQTSYYPTTMLGAVFEGRYMMFYNNGTATQCLVFDPRNVDAPFLPLAIAATGSFKSNRDDTLFLNVGNNLTKFGQGTKFPYTWKSKKFFMSQDTGLAWGRVVADSYPIEIDLYIDGNTTPLNSIGWASANNINSNRVFRLPPELKRAKIIQFEIKSATSRVDSIVLSSSRNET